MKPSIRSLLKKILTHEMTAKTLTEQMYWAKHWARLFLLGAGHVR